MNFSSMIAGERNIPLHQRRRLSLGGVSNSKDSSEDNLDLFSDESDASEKLGSLSIESAKQSRSGLDDLLSSTDAGKHDYDWLLTPPGTPLVPPLDINESRSALVAPRGSPSIRSTSTIKASRLSASQSESSRPARPTRSSSATRPSVSSFQYGINSNKSNPIHNTSSASVSSFIRSSTPTSRSSSVTRPSTPSARAKVSRSSTPCKVHPAPNIPSTEKPRPSQNSRPSTPISRPHVSANTNSIGVRSTSRPSTPTRRNPSPSHSIFPATGPSASGGRTLSRQNLSSVSRPSSPGPRVRPQPKPIVPPDFPLETPPNLRTTLPDRPPSAGRSRPGAAITLKRNTETTSSTAFPRRQSSPMVVRGRITEPIGRGRMHANGPLSDHTIDTRRELSARKPVKISTESTGFGQTISKKSLDVAIRNMDIKNGANGTRPLTGSNLYPQSIRSANQKSQSSHSTSSAASVNGTLPFGKHDTIAENRNTINRFSESGNEDDKSSAKLSNVDIYESSRYDMILRKEDSKNTNWLHSVEDESDQEPIFDNGLEPPPEPFSPL
ncbi:mucin-5AC-like isoform X2 [Olea europaea var. sylvestris]|uniref:mucin-5AC-like isoform X1 n=1 Tax=Olea europaea var. sylvestris TaxID=158386 RepID=UPI000C1CFC35|nr:mucin-5AC-like isoform X1 [Olea europaea var. sylvestris]XP_022890874.1 mucin-5AC-like isoform X2 [Olea europaea var. sylvestris]